jgi:hypothetical protein
MKNKKQAAFLAIVGVSLFFVGGMNVWRICYDMSCQASGNLFIQLIGVQFFFTAPVVYKTDLKDKNQRRSLIVISLMILLPIATLAIVQGISFWLLFFAIPFVIGSEIVLSIKGLARNKF